MLRRPVIRITTQSEGSRTVLTVDGWLADTDLGELRRAAAASPGELMLRLRGLEDCVPAGIRLLQEWLQAGARLESASPFLHMLLEPAQRDADAAPDGSFHPVSASH